MTVERPAPRWRESVVVFAVLLAAVAATLGDYALTWDEPYYLWAEERQREWMALLLDRPSEALAADAIVRGWNAEPYHNPHPPFYKLVGGVTRWALEGALDPVAAHRVGSALFFALAGLALHAWVRRARGRWTAWAAVLLWATTPRVFAHAHYAVTDTPMSAFAVATTYAFVRAIEETGRRWRAALGLALGAAFATKFTAVLLPVPLVAWSLLHRERRAAPVLAGAAAVALPTAILLVPYWWHDPVGGIAAYVHASTAREQVSPIGVVWACAVHPFRAPAWYPWAMLAVATPITVVAPAALRLAQLLRRPVADRHASLVALGFLVPIAAVTLPAAPKHDGLRLFLPSLPFLAALAAETVTGALGRLPRRTATAALAALVLVQGSATVAYHPYQLTYYDALVGGLAGARERGLEVSYWMEGFTPEVLREIERRLPPGAVVGLPVGDPFYFRYQQARGRLRRDLSFYVDDGTQPWLLVSTRVATLGCERVSQLEGVPAVVELRVDGVRVVALYERAAVDTAAGAG